MTAELSLTILRVVDEKWVLGKMNELPACFASWGRGSVGQVMERPDESRKIDNCMRQEIAIKKYLMSLYQHAYLTVGTYPTS